MFISHSPIRERRHSWLIVAAANALIAVCTCIAAVVSGPYAAKSGKVEFSVGSNIPLVKVAGSSTSLRGSGEATVDEATATVRNLQFEVDPATFKTGIGLRDQHLQEKVFKAADGSMPKVVLKAERFQAKLNPQTSKWEGTLQGQLTLRGVTKPVTFQASGEKNGDGAIVDASGTVKTSAFGVKQISYSGATVNDEVKVTVTDLKVAPNGQ